MSAINTSFEAAMGAQTELVTELEVGRSPGHCKTLEPRWWILDIGVRARITDSSAQPVPRPSEAEFRGAGFGSRAPLHLRVSAGLLDGRSGSSRSWLVDLVSMRTFIYASTITAYVVGPAKLVAYTQSGKDSVKAERLVHARVSAGIWALDTPNQRHGTPGPIVRGTSCTMRVQVPADEMEVAVPIPPGARSMAIYDSSGSSSPWTWQLGEPAIERVGRVTLTEGQSLEPALAPHFTHVAPAERHGEDRDVLLVFGVEL